MLAVRSVSSTLVVRSISYRTPNYGPLTLSRYTPREQLAHDITTQNNKEHGGTFAEFPERITEELLLRLATCKYLSLSLSLSPLFFLSLSCFALSVSRFLFLCFSLSLSLYFTQSVPQFIAPFSLLLSFSLLSFSFCLSFSHFLSFLSQPVITLIRLTLSLSLSFLLSAFFLFCFHLFLSLSLSLSFSLSLFLTPTHSLDPTHFISATREQTARAQHHHAEQQRTGANLRRISRNPQPCAHNSTTSSHIMTKDPQPPCMINFLKLCTYKTKLAPATTTTKTEQSQRQNCPCRGNSSTSPEPPFPRTCHHVDKLSM